MDDEVLAQALLEFVQEHHAGAWNGLIEAAQDFAAKSRASSARLADVEAEQAALLEQRRTATSPEEQAAFDQQYRQKSVLLKSLRGPSVGLVAAVHMIETQKNFTNEVVTDPAFAAWRRRTIEAHPHLTEESIDQALDDLLRSHAIGSWAEAHGGPRQPSPVQRGGDADSWREAYLNEEPPSKSRH